jgi:hypothetical protein
MTKVLVLMTVRKYFKIRVRQKVHTCINKKKSTSFKKPVEVMKDKIS